MADMDGRVPTVAEMLAFEHERILEEDAPLSLDIPIERNRREIEEAEMRSAREGPLADINTPLMSDQEIRARALECATRMMQHQPMNGENASQLMHLLRQFEAYIKNDK